MSGYDRQWAYHTRRGVVAPLLAVTCAAMLGFVAISVDVGLLYNVRAEAQRSADAAALASVAELLDEDVLAGSPDSTAEQLAARDVAAAYAARNIVYGGSPEVDLNLGNATNGDVVIGYLGDPTDRSEPMSFADPDAANSVCVRVRRSPERNGPVKLFFARIFGFDTANVSAEATALIKDGAAGYHVTGTSGNAQVLPFALHVDAWNALINGMDTSDSYAVDSDTNVVSKMPDGIGEINLYPGAGADQLTPGNLGTVDIGSANNSAADITRQILYGVSAEDLAPYGGELRLGEDGTLALEGDTGMSAGIKTALEQIIGQPRAILLFTTVSGPGNNAIYTIVGFGGIRIMDVQLTGAMTKKSIVIQPAFVVDGTVITEEHVGTSYYIYHPPILVR